MGTGAKKASWKSENWGGKRWTCSVFLGMLLLHGLATLMFTRGFLLTRSELSQHSQCGDVSDSPCFSPPHDQISNTTCWTKPAVDRIVIIVLDAIRIDFVAPSAFFTEKKPWMDKLQVIHELASRNQSSARIFKAIADPPTTSLQRLKGLTTGGLPTFIDIGNSFGAPAIVEDNLIHQLVSNGKRVMMMGDDTWLQLFPHHFATSYPFPSFNVKDLHTVDDGCTTNLFPALYEGDWDVLIAHFLGVDHAGHIFGVDSNPMIEKLEQYNEIIKKVVGVLETQSGPGGLHENTMLLVMGDHGQTLNGDHGGGSAEEVETAMFALTLKKPPTPPSEIVDNSSCILDVNGMRICINTIYQLDFAVTVSALLGIPFPFGSIGRVNSQLFSLAGGTSTKESLSAGDASPSETDSWMKNYANVLCINSWQVKKYIDVYSSLSLIGFSEKDLLHISELYTQAQKLWEIASKNSSQDISQNPLPYIPSPKRLIDAYTVFLESVADLARSNWTEFNLKIMGMGFCIMLISLFLHIFLIMKLDKQQGLPTFLSRYTRNSTGTNFVYIAVLIRAGSFLSNSFILEEGRVAAFLLATTAILQLRCAIMKNTMLLEAIMLCLLVPMLRFAIELGQLKQAVNSLFLKVNSSNTLILDSSFMTYFAEFLPVLALIIIGYLLYKRITSSSSQNILTYVISGSLFIYPLIPLYWASDSKILKFPMSLGSGNLIPRVIYAAGVLQLLVAIGQFFLTRQSSSLKESTFGKTLAVVSAWSSTIMILSGKQGPLVFLAFLVGGWCLIRLMALEQDAKNNVSFALPVTQWSLLAVCLFFSSGHWCAFDGLRYASAFVGFDEFNLIQQAILLTIDTFGFSHIIPILGLPLIVAFCSPTGKNAKPAFAMRLCQVYLMYGLVTATTTTFTMLCVTLQRRHLMVWGLFAPKFVFDVLGLLLTDGLILLSSLYYIV